MTDTVQAIPVLASLDLAESEAFYADALGFETTRFPDYLIARRGGIEIHFWLAQDRIHPENTSCYLRGPGIDALYDEYRARGGMKLSPFEARPWGMKEFYVWDPHGNLLKFGYPVEG